jgi:hypothetical protein
METKSEKIASEEVVDVTPERILSTLKSAEKYIARSIYVSSHLLEYHSADAAVLFSHANLLNITVPPYMEEKVEEFLFKDLSGNYENLPFKNLVSGFFYLFLRGYTLEKLESTVERIFSFQHESGGIGAYKGDIGRIPHTAEFLSPILCKKHVNDPVYRKYNPRVVTACRFIIDEWNKDYSHGIAVPHKGAYVVSTLSKGVDLQFDVPGSEDTIRIAVETLLDLQLDNGAWTYLPKMSMKRVKLASSVPNMTALAMRALCDAYMREKSTDIPILKKEVLPTIYGAVKKGCEYLLKTHTAFGFWYAHSIAESTHITGESALALKKSLGVLRDGK